jgi:SNF2 family DNA or RNA helicase
MPFVLRDYQLSTVQYAVENPYCILALEMGLGKSYASLHAAFQTSSKVLVICPSYLLFNWKNEVEKFFPGKIVSVFNSANSVYRPWDTDIALLSYGIVEKAEVLFEWAETVIIDEAHYIKNMKAKRTDVIHRFIYENSIKRLMLLTGTPIENRVWELYSLIALCNYNPKIKDSVFLNKFPTYEDFADYFSYRQERTISTNRGKRKVVTWEGRKNIPELKERYLKNIFIRYRAEDCLDLPESIYYDIMIDEIDDGELLEAFREFNGENDTVGPKIKAEIALRKVPFTVSYAKELRESGAEKIIIYSDHVGPCEEIAKALGVTPIHGGISVERRRMVAHNFIHGTTNFLVATIGSFSTGVNLTEAQDMIFNDYPWVPGRLAQAEARIRRMGQKFVCRFHRILGSIQDKYILNKISEKNETINEVVDGIKETD